MSTALLSNNTFVETPFIIAKIGEYTFGSFSKKSNGNRLDVTFPNYMTSLNIVKVNGAVNTYTLVLTYTVTHSDDPNMIDKILSSASTNREIILSYGDYSNPSFTYKEEKAVITKVTQNVDFQASKIVYTIKCVSSALALQSVKRDFGASVEKPSDVIFRLLDDESTGLQDLFPGMRNIDKVRLKNLIESDDQAVQLEAKDSINILDYIAYLVSCMVSTSEGSGGKKSTYYWSVYDDITSEMGGQHFRVRKILSDAKYNVTYNTYEVDVGYPNSNMVTGFSINNDDSWSIIYNYSHKVQQPQYSYVINDEGKLVEHYSPSYINTKNTGVASTSQINWWKNMTQFPITAKLTIKGLLRPAMLMSYVKINSYFYGNKHISSGLYIITRQEDTIDGSGYKTTLSLTRISGDEEYERA